MPWLVRSGESDEVVDEPTRATNRTDVGKNVSQFDGDSTTCREPAEWCAHATERSRA